MHLILFENNTVNNSSLITKHKMWVVLVICELCTLHGDLAEVAPVLHAPVSSSPREQKSTTRFDSIGSLSLSLYLRVNMHKNVKVTIASSVARDLPACPCSERVQYFFQHLFDSDRHEGS